MRAFAVHRAQGGWRHGLLGLLAALGLAAGVLAPGARSGSAAVEPCGAAAITPKSAPHPAQAFVITGVSGGATCSDAKEFVEDIYTYPHRSASGTAEYVYYADGYTCLLTTDHNEMTCRRGDAVVYAVVRS